MRLSAKSGGAGGPAAAARPEVQWAHSADVPAAVEGGQGIRGLGCRAARQAPCARPVGLGSDGLVRACCYIPAPPILALLQLCSSHSHVSQGRELTADLHRSLSCMHRQISQRCCDGCIRDRNARLRSAKRICRLMGVVIGRSQDSNADRWGIPIGMAAPRSAL